MLNTLLFASRIVAAALASPGLFAVTLIPRRASRRGQTQSLASGLLVAGPLAAAIVYAGIVSRDVPAVHDVLAVLCGAFSIGASIPVAWSAIFHSRHSRRRPYSL